MRQFTVRRWLLRLASSVAVILAFLISLNQALRAQTGTLIVSNYGSSSLSLFPIVNGIPGTPTTVPSGAGFALGEGLSCVGSQLFVADNGPSIYTYNLSTQTSALFTTVSTSPPPSFTALSLSSDGLILYGAGDNGHVYGFYTSNGAQIPNSPFSNPAAKWHDLVADPDPVKHGMVYATDFQTPSQGVVKFDFNTGIATPFITPPPGVEFTGLAFDTLGNLWISDFGTDGSNNTTRPGVYEYNLSGAVPTLVTSITGTQFINPLGLSKGPPGDPNMYVANFSYNPGKPNPNGQVLKITVNTTNPAADTVSVLVPNSGLETKYVGFQQNCIPPPNGLLKICKVAGPGIAVGTPFTFTAGSSAVTVPAGPAPGGTCVIGPSLPVCTSAAVTETIPSGDAVSNITVAPPGQSVSTNLAKGIANVTIGSGVTEVTYTDYTTMGYLEICKQGDVNTKGNFTFTVNPGNLGPFSVPLGACTPAIQVTAGSVVITETPIPPAPGTVMFGCATIPATQQGACNTAAQTSTVTVAPGDLSTETVAIITNRPGHP